MPAQDPIISLQRHFPGKVGQPTEFRGDRTVEVDREIIRAAADHLKNELGFNFLVDISSVDHFGDEPRYEVVYEFCALGGPHNQAHLRVKVKVSEDDPSVDSILPVYQGADWHEREIFDMMGINFAGHPNLRRILMWEGYPYHPLRKDFPLEGLPSDLPGEEGFSRRAPMEGGPFVATPADKPPTIGDAPTTVHEPRANPAEH
ncbi:MAG: NADH-quinone oxidoreductase subunit C [Methylacidiphilales bacterium]|nr:NADH-quinone oxidoreductase subunit C [Candidatus Methylacidiphilales bacterium]